MSLWFCLRLPRLPLESLHLPPVDAPYAVYERRGSRKAVLTVNAQAQALGVTEGETLSAATALAPQLKAFERNPRAEREALQAISSAAYGFSAQVSTQTTAPSPRCEAVWLEIASSMRLFGGAAPLARQLTEKLGALGYTSRAGMASTLEAAYLLGLDHEDEAAALRRLPVQALPVEPEITQGLRESGIRTVGELLNIPSDALARRFGPVFMDYLGRLTGRLPDARRYYRPPEKFRRRFELNGGAESTETLRFPVKRLLSEFAAYLVARDTGAQSCTFEFTHEDHPLCEARVPAFRNRTRRPATMFVVNFSSPTRDLAHLQVVVNAQLERVRVPAPVEEITLSAASFAAPRVRQFDLFRCAKHECRPFETECGGQPHSADEAEWQAVLDRLVARLGPDKIYGLGLQADHRPEKSWMRLPPGMATGVEPQAERPLCEAQVPAFQNGMQRPLWLLPEPRLLPALPNCIRGPERIEGGWWEGLDAQRDYYVAEAAESARLWIFRERPSQQWYLHGLWA